MITQKLPRVLVRALGLESALLVLAQETTKRPLAHCSSARLAMTQLLLVRQEDQLCWERGRQERGRQQRLDLGDSRPPTIGLGR
jgi:hypothetical protein